jgi:hypothetical protein
LLVFVGSLGCDDPRPTDAGTSECGDGPGTVTVAEGGSRLRPLPETGGALPIVLGAQGGIHVLVGFTARDMALDMRATYTLTSVATDEVLGEPTVVDLRPTLFTTELGVTQRNPDLVVLDNETPDVDRFAGQLARLSLEAVSADSHACDDREVTLVAP